LATGSSFDLELEALVFYDVIVDDPPVAPLPLPKALLTSIGVSYFTKENPYPA
jgi:hypothetical protein